MANKNVLDIEIVAKDLASKVIENVNAQMSSLGTTANAQNYSLGQMAGAFAIGQLAANAFTSVISTAISSLQGLASQAFETGKQFVQTGIAVQRDLETYKVGFEVLLGSAEKASKTIDRIKQEAARTPFTVKGLTNFTQQLVSVTKNGDKAIDFLLDIGESLTALGKGEEELGRIITNLQQIGSVGKASMMDIKQFAFAGIPIFEMLQKQTGLTGEKLEDFISKGGVTFDLLTKMFDKATSKGLGFVDALSGISKKSKELLEKRLTPEAIKAMSVAWTKAKDDVDEFNKVMDSMGQGAFIDSLDDIGIGITEIMKAFDKSDASAGKFFGAFEKGANSLTIIESNLQDTIEQGSATFVERTGIYNLQKDAIRALSSNLGVLIAKTTDFTIQIRDAIANNTVFRGIIDDTRVKIDELRGKLQETADGALTVFRNRLPEIQKNFETLATEGKRLLDEMLKLLDANVAATGSWEDAGTRLANATVDAFNNITIAIRVVNSVMVATLQTYQNFYNLMKGINTEVSNLLNKLNINDPRVRALLSGGTLAGYGVNGGISGRADQLPTPRKQFATGGEFVVPQGFNRDNFLIGVSSNEKVKVSRGGESTGSNRSVNIYNNITTNDTNMNLFGSRLAFQLNAIA